MQTVIETPAFLASAADEGLGDDERARIVIHLARNPEAGDLMAGTGGASKVRFAGRGKGKSGGYRVVIFLRLWQGHAGTSRRSATLCARS